MLFFTTGRLTVHLMAKTGGRFQKFFVPQEGNVFYFNFECAVVHCYSWLKKFKEIFRFTLGITLAYLIELSIKDLFICYIMFLAKTNILGEIH